MTRCIRRLAISETNAALALLTNAFANDPTHRWLLQVEQPGYAERLDAYLHAYLTYHHSVDLPTLGLFADDALQAAAWLTPAGYQPQQQAWQTLGAAITEHCGSATLTRLARLFAFAEQAPHADHYSCLEFIAVSPAVQGQGLGQQLLKALQHSTPNGLQLITGNPRAAAFYKRLGFVPWGRDQSTVTEQIGLCWPGDELCA